MTPSPGLTQPYSSVSVIPGLNINGSSNLIGTTAVTLLTCPAGKKIKILKCSIESNGGGANTRMAVRINSLDMDEIPVVNENFLSEKQNVAGQILTPTDTLNLWGDNVANNGAGEYFVTYEELSG